MVWGTFWLSGVDRSLEFADDVRMSRPTRTNDDRSQATTSRLPRTGLHQGAAAAGGPGTRCQLDIDRAIAAISSDLLLPLELVKTTVPDKGRVAAFDGPPLVSKRPDTVPGGVNCIAHPDASTKRQTDETTTRSFWYIPIPNVIAECDLLRPEPSMLAAPDSALSRAFRRRCQLVRSSALVACHRRARSSRPILFWPSASVCSPSDRSSYQGWA